MKQRACPSQDPQPHLPACLVHPTIRWAPGGCLRFCPDRRSWGRGRVLKTPGSWRRRRKRKEWLNFQTASQPLATLLPASFPLLEFLLTIQRHNFSHCGLSKHRPNTPVSHMKPHLPWDQVHARLPLRCIPRCAPRCPPGSSHMHHLQLPARSLGLVPSACTYAIPSPWSAPSQLLYGANSYVIYKSQVMYCCCFCC